MKASDTGLLLLSNGVLIAGVLAEALPADSIPIQCATICGPMVELSLICSGGDGRGKDFSLLNRRRNTANENRGVAAERKEKAARHPKGGVDMAERDFTVIVSAPTSFPSSLLAQEGTPDAKSRSKITRIFPTPIFPTQAPPPQPQSPPLPSPPSSPLQTSSSLPSLPPTPPPSPPSQSSSSSLPLPPPLAAAPPSNRPSSTTPTQPSDEDIGSPTTVTPTGFITPTVSQLPKTSMDAMEESDGDGDGDGDSASTMKPDQDQGRWNMNSGEENCVCQNKSFDVPKVAALCASCIAGADQQQNDMNVIMETCKFAPLQYSPDQDRVVNNIQVHAISPKAMLGQNAGVASAGAMMLIPARGVQIAVGAACGLLQLLFL